MFLCVWLYCDFFLIFFLNYRLRRAEARQNEIYEKKKKSDKGDQNISHKKGIQILIKTKGMRVTISINIISYEISNLIFRNKTTVKAKGS